MAITALYAALLAPLFLFLTARVIGRRRQARISLGPGDDAVLLRRMRVHANFAEYAPFALVCLALAESVKAPSVALHAAGLLLVVGRYVHAFGVSQDSERLVLRVSGMTATLMAIGLAAVLCLWGAFSHLVSFAP